MLNTLTKLIPIQYKDLDPSIKGRSFGVVIQIDNKYKEDKGLLAHERAHARQFLKFALTGLILSILTIALGYIEVSTLPLMLTGVHGLLYKFSSTYRYKAEVEAFGYSILYGNRTKESVKNSLTSFYGIDSKTMKDYGFDINEAIENARGDFDELSK